MKTRKKSSGEIPGWSTIGPNSRTTVQLTVGDFLEFRAIRRRMGLNHSRAVRSALTMWSDEILRPGEIPSYERPVYPWSEATKISSALIPFTPLADRLIIARGLLGLTMRDVVALAIVSWIARYR